MERPLYFDYAATTPVDERVSAVMMKALSQDTLFGNAASSLHYYGWEVAEEIQAARGQVASAMGAQIEDIVWTSGATESNNLAILGIARANRSKGCHIITTAIEHKSVLGPCQQLEKEGFELTVLKPNADGMISIDSLQAALRPDTILVSTMMINNEVGVIQPIAAIGAMLAGHSAYFHVDAAQAAGRVAINVGSMRIDALSLSAHKMYGPKGCGILYLRRSPKVRCLPLFFGGEQEQGVRPGTLATHQIMGIAKAFEIAEAERDFEFSRLLSLKQQLWSKLQVLEGIILNGSFEHASPHILNVSFEGVDGEALLMALHPFALSLGSACNTASVEPSHVLLAIGQTPVLAHSSLRFSFGRYTTLAQVQSLGEAVVHQVNKLRALSPLWKVGTKLLGFK